MARKTYRYTLEYTFRNGGRRTLSAVTTSEAQARRDCWCGLDCQGLDPARNVRRVDLVSKVPEALTGLDAHEPTNGR